MTKLVASYTLAQLLATRCFGDVRARTAAATDARVKTTNEILSGIRALRMYAWEEPFRQLVEDQRAREIRNVRTSALVRGLNLSIYLILVTVASLLWSVLSAIRSFPRPTLTSSRNYMCLCV